VVEESLESEVEARRNYPMWESICEVLRAARADGNGMRCLSTVYGDLWGVEAQMLSA
jgi:hypothetical protein